MDSWAVEKQERSMNHNSTTSVGWAIILIMLGVAALFGGVWSLIVLIPAAMLVWYAGPLWRRSRN